MGYISSFDGTRICFEEIGTGYPLVISPTFGNASSLWKPIFKGCKGKFRFIWICHRALFGSGIPEDPKDLTMEASGKDIGHVLETLELEDYGAVGYCSGNFPLCEYLRYGRRLPRRLVLSSPRFGNPYLVLDEDANKRNDTLLDNPKAREASLRMLKQLAKENPAEYRDAYEALSVPGAFEAQVWQTHWASRYSIQAPDNPQHQLHISLVAGENEKRYRDIEGLRQLFEGHFVTNEFIPNQGLFYWKEVPDLMVDYLERTFLSS